MGSVTVSLFHDRLREVCKRPGMYVGSRNFHEATAYLFGYDSALHDTRPDRRDDGLLGFREWLAVGLDSCMKSQWPEIIFREFPDEDKFEKLEQLYEEFARDRDERGLEAIRKDYETRESAMLSGSNAQNRDCWCLLPTKEERDRWRPRKRHS